MYNPKSLQWICKTEFCNLSFQRSFESSNQATCCLSSTIKSQLHLEWPYLLFNGLAIPLTGIKNLQATLPAMKFRNCKPSYMWLPLKRKNSDLRNSIGELHLRIQWTSDEVERSPSEEQPSWALEVHVNGVGYSLIEANELNYPREVNIAWTRIHTTFFLDMYILVAPPEDLERLATHLCFRNSDQIVSIYISSIYRLCRHTSRCTIY